MLSDGKLATLLALLPGPMGIAELSAAIQASDTTAIHFTAALRKTGDVAKEKGIYSLTSTGRMRAMVYHSTVAGLAAIDEQKAFWEKHDISAFPEDLLSDIGCLAGGQLTVASRDDPLASQKSFVAAVRTAKEFYGISCVDAPQYAEMIIGLVEAGSHVELILTRPVIEKIDPRALQKVAGKPNFQLYEIDDCRLGFTVTECLISLAMCFPDGRYDPQEDLICEGPDAVRWGRRLFEYYKEKARKINKLNFKLSNV